MERPRIKIDLTAVDYIVEIVSLLSILGAIALYVIYWIKAPDTVPIHYNIYGEADGYGSKSEMLILPICTVLFYVGLTILNKYPHIFNFPTAVTEENVLSLYKIATRGIRWMKLLCCLLFTYMIWHEVRIIINQEVPKLDGFSWIFIACIAIFPIILIVKMTKAGKKNKTI